MLWWKDIDITLEKKRNGDIQDMLDVDAIRNSLINIFKTVPGSRRRLPEFALNLYYLLFDPIDEITAREIGEIMYDVIERWEQRIIIEDLYIIPNHDKLRYDVTLKFYIKNIKSPEPYVLEDTISAA